MSSEIDQFFIYFMNADKLGALNYIDKWAVNNSYERALTEIVEPALQIFGEKWANEEDVNLAQGYISAKISEEVLLRVAQEKGTDEISNSRAITVLGNIEDDYHALGRKMVSNFLQSSGWTVYDLGNDVLAEDFVDKAVEVNASIIGASAMMYSNAKNMIKVRQVLDERNLSNKIKYVVGGTIFNLRPDLYKEVGADATAKNAIEAVKLFDQMLQDLERNHE